MKMTGYNPDSMERALKMHVAEGRLARYSRHDDAGARARWQVTGNSGMHGRDETMSDRECAALCFGLASAHYAAPAEPAEAADLQRALAEDIVRGRQR